MTTAVFEDIRLAWDGQPVVIPANRVLGAIARVEDVITFGELAEAARSNRYSVARLSRAFGAVLRYAGVEVGDDEVYAGVFSGKTHNVAASISVLLQMMIPPASLTRGKSEGNAPPAAGSKASRKRTSSRSR